MFIYIINLPCWSRDQQVRVRLIGNVHKYCSPPPIRNTYFYGEYQEIFSSIRNVNFIQGLPENLINKFDGLQPEWIIIDDLM